MQPRLKISPHQHTGKRLPHRQTSYAGLAFLMFLVGLILLSTTRSATAATPYDGPEAGSIGLHGKVPAPPPKTAAVIKTPFNGQHFSQIPITVSGTCPKNTIVEVFENSIFAGSDFCQDNETFKFQINLLPGANDLVARVYDALEQTGPDSNTVTVYYDVAPSQPNIINSNLLVNPQLILQTKGFYHGVFPGQSLTVPLDIIGGAPPFALEVDWGDGKSDLKSYSSNDTVPLEHTYNAPGNYRVVFKVSDKAGVNAFLQVVVIVNGPAQAVTGDQTPQQKNTATKLKIAWPLWLLGLLVILAFWLGEKREEMVLRRKQKVMGVPPSAAAA